MARHICPVCGKPHEVHAVLDQLSYGRYKTCSPHCKSIYPELVRARVLAEMARNAQDVGCQKTGG